MSQPCVRCQQPAVARIELVSRRGRTIDEFPVCEQHRDAEQRLAVIGIAEVHILPLEEGYKNA